MLSTRVWGFAAVLLLAASVASAAEVKNLVKEFKKAVASDQESEAISLVGQIAGVGGEEALEGLYDIGFSDYSAKASVYDAIIKAFNQPSGAIAFIDAKYEKSKSKPDFRERVFQVDVLNSTRENDAVGSVTVLMKMLDDKSVHVQSAAVMALQKSMVREAVEPLLKLLDDLTKKKRRDTLYYDVQDALLLLTGFQFETMEDWWNWWEPNAASFDPKATNTGGKTGVERKREKDDSDFFGVPILSQHVVFVLDTSGSMRYVMRDDIKGLSEGDGSDSGGGKPSDEQMTAEGRLLAQFWTRLECAKRNLKRVIRRLKPGTSYNLVSFDSDVLVFQKGAVTASPGVNSKAFKWIDGMKHQGETNTLDALKSAFGANAKTTDLYLLSDGLPSKDGKRNDPTGPILDEVKAMNRFRKIKIHTFGFAVELFGSGGQQGGLAEANAFLKQLAESTGGKFTLIKVNPKETPDNPDPAPEKDPGEKKNSTLAPVALQ
ncbi:MAG: hypothetical protein AB7I09_18635 [Planctomycetota bacterium]